MKRTSEMTKAFLGGGVVLLFVFAFIGNAVAQQTCTPPPAGLVSWWPGDGNANDIIGSNNGVLLNGATFASGLVGQAFSFDGVDDFVAVPSSTDFDTQTVTLDAWVRPNPGFGDEFAGHIGVIGRWGGGDPGKATWMLSLNASGQVLFWTHDGVSTTALVSQSTIPVNAFSHIAATLEGSTAKIYINGALDVVGTVLVPQPTSFFAVNIGIGGQPQDPDAPSPVISAGSSTRLQCTTGRSLLQKSRPSSMPAVQVSVRNPMWLL